MMIEMTPKGSRIHRSAFNCMLIGLSAMLASGCSQPVEPHPPVIYIGQHECDVCRMIISEERFAAALVIEDGRGRYEDRVFDDIGCLLQYEIDEPHLTIAARYVRSASDASWLDAEAAQYLHSANVKSPMAYHVAAYADAAQAQIAQRHLAGEIIDFRNVGQRFNAGTLRDVQVPQSGAASRPSHDSSG